MPMGRPPTLALEAHLLELNVTDLLVRVLAVAFDRSPVDDAHVGLRTVVG